MLKFTAEESSGVLVIAFEATDDDATTGSRRSETGSTNWSNRAKTADSRST